MSHLPIPAQGRIAPSGSLASLSLISTCCDLQHEAHTTDLLTGRKGKGKGEDIPQEQRKESQTRILLHRFAPGQVNLFMAHQTGHGKSCQNLKQKILSTFKGLGMSQDAFREEIKATPLIFMLSFACCSLRRVIIISPPFFPPSLKF